MTDKTKQTGYTMTQYDIYGIGAALVDTEIEVSDEFLAQNNIEKGVMTLVDEQRQNQLMDALQNHLVGSKRASGGSAANSIIGAACMGAKNFYSCQVASDDNGKFYIDDLNTAGVASLDKAGQGITGKCLVMITDDAERTMNTFLGISETLSTENLDFDALAQSKWLYFEGYLVSSDTGRAAAIAARKFAEEKGIKTAISLSDPAMVQFFKDGLVEMIGDKVDLLFCNHEEAMAFTNTDTVDTAFEALKPVANNFAITRGADGASIFDGTNRLDVPSKKVTAIDTNGAGDAFAAGFLYALSQNLGFDIAGKLAVETAAQVVSQYGPRLTTAEYQRILAENS